MSRYFGSRNNFSGLGVQCPLGETSDARQDLIGRSRPDERLRIRVMRSDEFADGRFELGHTAVRPTAQLFRGELGNQRSTRFSHDPYVGVKCTWKRGRLSSQFLISGVW